MAKILYIAGYGRSGSTIVDIILGNHSEIVGVGEVSFLLDDWSDPNRRCSCGKPYRECEFWGDFLDHDPAPKLPELARSIERVLFLPRLLSNLIPAEDRTTYADYQRRLFEYIESRTGKSIIVDSSKSARYLTGRLLSLQKLAHQDVYVLHLVRNGLDTMASLAVTGSNWALENHTQPRRFMALRSVAGWVSANVWASMLGRRLGPGRYLRLRYEDFLADPSESLRMIGKLCGFDPEELIERIHKNDHFQVGHMVGGNRVRFEGRVRLRRSGNSRNRQELRIHHRLIFAIFGGWLQHRYGYLGS